MCKKHKNDNKQYGAVISSSNKCCSITYISKKITDNFVNDNPTVHFNTHFAVLDLNVTNDILLSSVNGYYSDKSPPSSTIPIYIFVSNLLI
ncbi:MAG: hypothetical protein Q8903_08510 [Bacteroidota bacterium]|nr:hypothetical protein [Bacteroidota bacterium]